MRLIFYLIAVGMLSGCNFLEKFEINTVDPQLNSSIFQSINRGVFVCAYKEDTWNFSNKDLKIKEAWIEKGWKFIINDRGEKDMEILSYNNLVIRLEHSRNLAHKNYLLTWLLNDEKNDSFESSNEVYGIEIESDSLPVKTKIYVEQMTNKMDFTHTKRLFEIYLIKGCK